MAHVLKSPKLPQSFSKKKKKFKFLFIYLAMPGPSCGMWDLVPQQESNLGPLEQERGVLAVGPGGMSQESLLRSQVRIGVAGYVISLYRVL